MTPDDTTATPPAPTPTLPEEVREAIARTLHDSDYDALDGFNLTEVDDLCAALAPLWPRPAVTAPRIEENPLHRYVTDPRNDGTYELHLGPEETRKLWDELDRLVARPAPVTARIKPDHAAADAFWAYWRENGETHKHGYYESTWGAINAALSVAGQALTPAPVTADARELAERIHMAVFAGESHPDAETDAIAAVLAPVLARLNQAEAELRESPGHLLRRARNAEARAEAAERAEAEVARHQEGTVIDLQGNRHLCTMPLALACAGFVQELEDTKRKLEHARGELRNSYSGEVVGARLRDYEAMKDRAEAAERELEEMTGWRNECGFRYNQAKAERDQHASELAQARAEIVRLEKNLYTGDDDEKRDLRAALASAKQEVERLKGVAINGAGAQAFKDLRADIDRLNAEVAVLEGQLAAAEKQLAAAQEELTTYRHAECAIVQQRLFGRFLEGGSPTPLLDSIKRMLDAARREGGAT